MRAPHPGTEPLVAGLLQVGHGEVQAGVHQVAVHPRVRGGLPRGTL